MYPAEPGVAPFHAEIPLGCPSWSGAALDRASPGCSRASGTLSLRPRLGKAGRRDQGGMHACALAHCHAPRTEVGFHGLKDLLAQPVLLQQVAKGQDRGLIDAISDQFNAGKAAPGGNLDHGLLCYGLAERLSLLQQVDPQH